MASVFLLCISCVVPRRLHNSFFLLSFLCLIYIVKSSVIFIFTSILYSSCAMGSWNSCLSFRLYMLLHLQHIGMLG